MGTAHLFLRPGGSRNGCCGPTPARKPASTPTLHARGQPKLVNLQRRDTKTALMSTLRIVGRLPARPRCSQAAPGRPLGRRGRSVTTRVGVGIPGWSTGPGQVEQDHDVLGVDERNPMQLTCEELFLPYW